MNRRDNNTRRTILALSAAVVMACLALLVHLAWHVAKG